MRGPDQKTYFIFMVPDDEICGTVVGVGEYCPIMECNRIIVRWEGGTVSQQTGRLLVAILN